MTGEQCQNSIKIGQKSWYFRGKPHIKGINAGKVFPFLGGGGIGGVGYSSSIWQMIKMLIESTFQCFRRRVMASAKKKYF